MAYAIMLNAEDIADLADSHARNGVVSSEELSLLATWFAESAVIAEEQVFGRAAVLKDHEKSDLTAFLRQSEKKSAGMGSRRFDVSLAFLPATSALPSNYFLTKDSNTSSLRAEVRT